MVKNHSSPSAELLNFNCLQAFAALSQAIQNCVSLLSTEVSWCWLPEQPEQQDALAFYRELISDLWHQHQGDGRRTRQHPGLIGASPVLLQAAQRVNQCKDDFKQQVLALQQAFPQHLASLQQQIPERHPEMADLLNRRGLGRLHLKHCYRHLPCLPEAPSKVSFSWYRHGRSIKRISVAEAYQRLQRFDTSAPHIRIQLDKLASLAAATPLAQVQSQAPLLRANLVFAQYDPVKRQAMNLPLPLLFPWQPGQQPPQFKAPPPLPEQSGRSRQPRADARLQEEVFLPSLRVYLYQHPEQETEDA